MSKNKLMFQAIAAVSAFIAITWMGAWAVHELRGTWMEVPAIITTALIYTAVFAIFAALIVETLQTILMSE